MTRAKRRLRIVFAAFFGLYVLAVTYPGVIPFNRIRPMIFGLPFIFFWIIAWIIIGFVVLLIANAVESRE